MSMIKGNLPSSARHRHPKLHYCRLKLVKSLSQNFYTQEKVVVDQGKHEQLFVEGVQAKACVKFLYLSRESLGRYSFGIGIVIGIGIGIGVVLDNVYYFTA